MTKKKVSKIPDDKSVENAQVAPKTTTHADEIWNRIKNIQLDMFALPNQTPGKYCRPLTVEPTKLYLKFTAAAVYPALENALKDVYTVEMFDKLIVISDKKSNLQG